MLEDGAKELHKETIEVMDLIEILDRASGNSQT